MPRNLRPEIIGVVLLAALAVISPARRDLFVGDETKYAEVVREMRADGAILVPTLNGEPYTHKPPLHFWMIYGLTAVAGERTLWPYVLPALLSGVVLTWLVGRIALEWFGSRSVWPARFFLAGLALVWGLAQTARMDLLFACFTTAGAVSLYRYLGAGKTRDGAFAGVWFGLAGLVKGPMAILILLSLLVVESIARRRRPKLLDLMMIVISIMVPLLWFVPAVVSAGMPYLREILVRQTAGRVVASWVHREPPWYYLVASPVIVFPFFFLLAAAIRTARDPDPEAQPGPRQCVRWILAILVPFSLISSKLPVYMVPAFPPAALLVAWYLGLAPEKMRWSGFARWGNLFLAMLFLLGPLALLVGVPGLEGDGEALLDVWGIRAGLFAMAAVALVVLVAGWRSIHASSFALPFVLIVPLGIVLALGAQAINDYASSRVLVGEIERAYRPGDSVAMYYTPHLWSRTLPVELERAKQIDPGDLEAGERPDVLAVRSDKLAVLGTALADYSEVSSVRIMGKTFNVYRRR